MTSTRILIFAKAPLPCLAKTRLIPALGAEGAAKLAGKMLYHAMAEALKVDDAQVELCMSPDPDHHAWANVTIPREVLCSAQGEGNLGERLARASKMAIEFHGSILLMGTDCPQLTKEQISAAQKALEQCTCVLIPASDGGYVLLGFRAFDPSLFQGIAWSTETVAEETRQKIKALGWSLQEFPALSDIDLPEDLSQLPSTWQT